MKGRTRMALEIVPQTINPGESFSTVKYGDTTSGELIWSHWALGEGRIPASES